MEQPYRLLDKADAQLTRRFEAGLIILTPGRCCKVLDAGASTAVDIVGEREEGVT